MTASKWQKPEMLYCFVFKMLWDSSFVPAVNELFFHSMQCPSQQQNWERLAWGWQPPAHGLVVHWSGSGKQLDSALLGLYALL